MGQVPVFSQQSNISSSKISMSGYGILDGTTTGISSDVIMKNMDYFDFPMESLEGDDLNGGYWDAKLQSLVPILSGVLAGSSLTSGGNFSNAASVMVPSLSDPSQESALESVPNSVEEASRASISHQNNYSDGPVSVLGCRSSCSSATKSLSMTSEIIPRSKRSQFATIYTYRSAASEELPLASGFSDSNPSKTTRKPVRRLKKKKKKLAQLSGSTEIMQRSGESRKCSHCEVTRTPQWRNGPMGRKTLCNACGVQYGSGRLFAEYRPAASPTFVPSLHSNLHKEVVEMREKVQNFESTPSEAFLGSPLASGSNVGNAASIVGEESSEVKPRPNIVEATSRSSIFLHNDYSNGLDSEALQTPSPVSVHQSSSSCSSEMCVSTSSGMITRSMRSRLSTINPHRVAATEELPLPKGFFGSNIRITKKITKKNPVKTKPRMILKLPKQSGTNATRKCSHCASEKTPQWRHGPMGPKTLCNACGVRYRFGRLFPEYHPIASPAFIPSVHSNSQKVVVQMRKKAIEQGETKPPTSGVELGG